MKNRSLKIKTLTALMSFLIFCQPLFAQAFSTRIDIPEASAITCLPDGQFLIVDDEEGVYLFNPSSQKSSLILSAEQHKSLDDLEGITLATDGKTVYLLSEDGGRIFRSDLSIEKEVVTLGAPEALGSLAMLSNSGNKGYEGICIISLFGKDHLLAVHQEKPTALAIYSLPELKKITMCKLPDELSELLDNLSDVAIDQRNGHILLLSGKSGRLVEVKAKIGKDIEELEIVSSTNIRGNLAGKPEGLCFDAYERLVVVTDGGGEPSDFIRFDP